MLQKRCKINDKTVENERCNLVAILVVLEATVVVHETVHFLHVLILQLRLTRSINN